MAGTFQRRARVGRRRMRPREFRESILRLEYEAFNREVIRFVKEKAPANAATAVKKLALDLIRFVTRRTPMVTGRAAGGWLPFARAHGVSSGLVRRGSGTIRGEKEGSYTSRLRGPKPQVVLTNAVPYIMPIEVGSRPHLIEARRSKALRFVTRSGELIFRKRIMHPGTRAYHSLRHAYRDLRKGLVAAFGGLQA